MKKPQHISLLLLLIIFTAVSCSKMEPLNRINDTKMIQDCGSEFSEDAMYVEPNAIIISTNGSGNTENGITDPDHDSDHDRDKKKPK
jgi:hypothetical protein